MAWGPSQFYTDVNIWDAACTGTCRRRHHCIESRWPGFDRNPRNSFKYNKVTSHEPVPVAARLLGLRVRIPHGTWMSVCCVLSGRGLCDELITRPEESYSLCCVVVCDLETSRIGAPYIYIYIYIYIYMTLVA